MENATDRGELPMRRSRRVHYSAATRRNLWWRVGDDVPSSPRLRLNQSEA